jgi:Putative antitoxin
VWPFGAERRVVAVAGVDHRRVRVDVEHPAGHIAQQLLEIARLPRLADSARKETVAGEQMGGFNLWVSPVEGQRDRPGSMALQMDHVKGQVTDFDGVAVGQDPVRFDRQRVGVQLMGGGGHPGRLGHLGKSQPVVLMLVAGDDQRQVWGVALDECEQNLGVLGVEDGHRSASIELECTGQCMYTCIVATKTISVDLEAYERLRSARRSPNESFSQVIKRAQWRNEAATAAALLDALGQLPTVDDDVLARLDEAQLADAPPEDRWRSG